MALTPPELKEMQAEIDAITARTNALFARAKHDAYWAASAHQHLRNFAHAYKRAFHDAKPAEEGDLF